MEKTPKYKVGQKVWFVTENGKICYGDIVTSIPVGYVMQYAIRMNLDSIGEVTKQNVWEREVLGDFSLGANEVFVRAGALGIAKEIDKRIVATLLEEKGYCKEKPDNEYKGKNRNVDIYDSKFSKAWMGTIEPVYEHGLENDFSVKNDLAFILGAIAKYGKEEEYYADLVAYIMNMTFAMIRDMRSENNKENSSENE